MSSGTTHLLTLHTLKASAPSQIDLIISFLFASHSLPSQIWRYDCCELSPFCFVSRDMAHQHRFYIYDTAPFSPCLQSPPFSPPALRLGLQSQPRPNPPSLPGSSFGNKGIRSLSPTNKALSSGRCTQISPRCLISRPLRPAFAKKENGPSTHFSLQPLETSEPALL